jgi:hypothetical protein
MSIVTSTSANFAAVVSLHAQNFATAMADAVRQAANEAEIRSAVDRQLALLERAANIALNTRHEFTVASGRIDSVYDRVIIEYKNPNSPTDRIGRSLDAAGSQRLVNQIKSRFPDIENELGHSVSSLLGVGVDGRRFIFVRYRDSHWLEEEPVEISPDSAARFLWTLFNLGISGKAFVTTNLARDFGGNSAPATTFISACYNVITSTSDTKARTMFEEWTTLFGLVCGYDSIRSQAKIATLADFYGLAPEPHELNPTALIFAAHTYYAVFMKLLAAEIASFYHRIPSPIQRLIRAPTSQSLRVTAEDLESGGLFRHLNIENFLEGDLFSWYIAAWGPELDGGLRELVSALDRYNPGTLSEDPVHNQDLLKDLYLQIIPSEVRHDFGEYYTPDWVADLVFARIGFEGRSDQRILDPACGSGTFLISAISKIKQYYQFNREAIQFDEGELLRRILSNVVGFDINPLAVLASRTNYLIAIREFLPFSDRVELPVYLCDSVVTPAEYGDLFTGAAATARVPCAATEPPFLLVPKEVGTDASTIALYAGTIEHCIRVRFSSDEFVSECRERTIPIVDQELHKNLYQTLLDLQAERKNDIWVRIIKNSFAPLFAGKFDLIVGNPPWINWENLPPEYRDMSAGIWEHYRLLGHIPVQRRQVSRYSKTDAAILMTYVAADKYAKEGALLGLVLPRTIFQSELGGWHFRKFELPDERPLAVNSVDDIDRLRPFSGQATNMSCVAALTFDREPTRYPVPWNRWEPTRQVSPDMPYSAVRQVVTVRPIQAQPIDVGQRQSPWVVGDEACLRVLRSVTSPTVYAATAREGINTRGANGIFFVDACCRNRQIFITNRKSDGRNDRIDEITQSIEPEYLYPLLRGENVGRFVARPHHFVLVPHESSDPVDPVPFRNLPARTREFFAHFRVQLSERKKFRNFDPTQGPWHGLYSVLSATFSPYKVVWREMHNGCVAAAISNASLPYSSNAVVIPDHKLFLIPCSSMEEADFVSGFLNSEIANFIVASYVVTTGISTHILQRVPMPRFDASNPLHVRLSEVSRDFRECGTEIALLDGRLRELNRLVANQLDLGGHARSRIRDALAQLRLT